MSINGIKSAGGGGAWGDIFTFNTPYTDEVGKEIYAQAQQRSLQQQQESKALDDQFSKEAANIRDADVNDFADKYNDYKMAKIGLMKMDPNTNSKAYIQAQLDATRKLAAMSQFANESISAKAGLKNVNEEYSKDAVSGKGLFNSDTGTKIAKANALPTSQWPNLGYDPVNTDVYKFQGNLQNWQPILQKAAGTKPTTIKGTTTPLDPNHPELGTQSTTIEAKNSPSEYFNSVYGSFKGANAARSFNATYPSFSDQDAQQITEQYNQMMNDPNSNAVKAWGKQGMQLPTNALLTPEGRTLSLMSMKYALQNTPQEGKPIKDVNPVAVTSQKQAFSEKQMHERFNQEDYLAGLRNKYSEALSDYKQASTSKDQDNVLNKFINNAYDAGSSRVGGTTVKSVNIDGQQYSGKIVDLPLNVQKDFATFDADGKGTLPKAFLLTDDKKTIIPLSLSAEKGASGNYGVLPNSKPQSIEVLKASLAKDLLTKKQTGEAVTNDDFNMPSLNQAQTPKSTKTIEIKSDKIDISQLQKGQTYTIKGKNYIWNGEKFKAQ